MKKGLILNILSIVVFFLVWELLARFGVISLFFMSSPSKILGKMSEMFASGMMNTHVYYSIRLLFVAIVFSAVSGVAIGLMLYRFPSVYTFIKPLLFTLNSLPVLAISPIIILWFGFESSSKLIVMLITALPPIIINTYSGAKNTDPHLLKMADSFRVGKFSTLMQIVFFSAVPAIYAGLKILIGRCIIGLVIADMFGYGVGLGYLLNYFGSTSDTTGLFTITILLLAINYIFNLILSFGKYLFSKKYAYRFE